MEDTFKRLHHVRSLLTLAEEIYECDPQICSDISELAAKLLAKVNTTLSQPLTMPPLPESDEEEKHISLAELEFQDTAPRFGPFHDVSVIEPHTPPFVEEPLPAFDSATLSTNTSRRNFGIWAKTLNLPEGHPMFFGDVKFTFAFDKKGRATLTTKTLNGKTIIGYSPSGAIKGYLKATDSKRTNVDGWRRISMQNENFNLIHIGWPDWLLREWDPDANNFRVN